MNPLIGYGIVSGLGSLASGLFNNSQSQAMSKDLMNYQYKLQQQAIDAQNLYNSPAEQMKRLANANLNPNLVYGSGVDGNQSSAASPSIANRRSDMGNPLQDLGQAYLQSKQLQMQQIAARNEAFESQARRLNLQAKTLGVLADNKLKNATLDTNIKMAAAKLSNELINYDVKFETVNNLRLTAANLIEQGNLLSAKTNLTNEQSLTEVVKRQALRAGISLTNEQAREVGHRIRYYDAGSDLREQQHDIQELDFLSDKELQEWLADHPNAQLADQVIDHVVDKISRVMGGSRRVSKRGRSKSRRRRK